MINHNPICVFDFETCNLRCDETSPIQLAAIMLDPRTLEPIEGATFGKPVDGKDIIMKPLDWSAVDDAALRVNKKTREQLENGLEQKLVWGMFTDYLKKFSRDNTQWGRPIPAGHNIINFDLPIIEVLCRKYKNVDKNGQQNIFDPRVRIDTLQLLWGWFESTRNPEKLNMDHLRGFFGISSENAHDAFKDVMDTTLIIQRFLKFQREHSKRTKFAGAFAEKKEAVPT